MSGLLGSIFSFGDSLKKNLKSNVSSLLDPHTYQNAMNYDNYQPLSTDDLITGMLGVGGIVKPVVAKSLNTATSIPSTQLFFDSVSNTPGAQLVDDGLLMRVMRNQKPEQALQTSVRGGVFYLPEGSANARYYSSARPVAAYGGSERISGETLLSNPLFVKGATGGKAPEAAYDSLIGKGAYQQMRQDALRWSGGPQDIKQDLVTEFLKKYAPEMADNAAYIINNSKQSNQLAYALQEAAVGSAVRRAGNDSILGYSMTRGAKKTPFISELFDVREVNYPDRFGTPTKIWESFKK